MQRYVVISKVQNYWTIILNKLNLFNQKMPFKHVFLPFRNFHLFAVALYDSRSRKMLHDNVFFYDYGIKGTGIGVAVEEDIVAHV